MCLKEGKEFLAYHSKLKQLIQDKLGIFMLFFVALMVLHVLSLSATYNMQSPGTLVSFGILGFILKLAVDTVINLVIIFLVLYPYDNDWKKLSNSLLDFIKKHFVNAFLCLLLFVAILMVGLMLFVLPALVAFFFLHYCYLYVVISGSKIKDSFKQSYEFVRSILWLNSYVFGTYVLISIIALSIGGQYTQALIAAIGSIYITSLKILVFVDKSKKVK